MIVPSFLAAFWETVFLNIGIFYCGEKKAEQPCSDCMIVKYVHRAFNVPLARE